jgi:hypothetical protein
MSSKHETFFFCKDIFRNSPTKRNLLGYDLLLIHERNLRS